MSDLARRPWPRLLLFAFGDFAFNLYWQSIILFLLFYYTDTLALPVVVAAIIYTAATVWDGIANFVVGAITDRYDFAKRYRLGLILGAVPLGLACVAAYAPPLFPGGWGVAMVFAGHLLFRTAYAATNVPYLAMTARISQNPRDRALVAGARMVFGTCAWVLVARGTIPIGAWVTGSASAARDYFGAALVFAVAGAAILMLVGVTYREDSALPPVARGSVTANLRSLAANRAFVALNLAMMAMIVAATVLNKSVLYYFKYALGNEGAGQGALAWMGLVSMVAVPMWMVAQRVFGTRALWFVATGSSALGLVAFVLIGVRSVDAMIGFLVALQAMFVGLHFVFWAMLPNTIEYGEQATGIRVEGVVFGLAALLQRIAIGVATIILGGSLGAAGYIANAQQSPATLLALRLAIGLVPLVFLALSCVAMGFNPLDRARRGYAPGRPR